MIDFGLSDEQKALRDLAQEFSTNEIRPKAAEHDKSGEFPRTILQKAFDLGLMNTHIPEKFGGLGLSVLDGCLISEELANGCTGISTAMEANSLAQAPVIVAGNDEQKNHFLKSMTEALTFAAYCVTEPSAGSDVQGIKTQAKKVGNDYIINGQKMWITNGSVASWYFLLAHTDPSKGYKGMTGFLIPTDTDGIEVGKKEQNMGQRASDTRGITFTDVKVPEKYRLGKEGEGFLIAMKAFDHTRPVVSVSAIGLARRAMEESIKYAQQREAFGRPIAKLQAIGSMIADMTKDIDAGRFLVWHSAWLIDQGKRNTKEAAMAKAFCADLAMKCATDAVQVHGGYGYSQEYPVEKLMRDAKVFQIYEGTSQIQRVIIAKEVFDRQ